MQCTTLRVSHLLPYMSGTPARVETTPMSILRSEEALRTLACVPAWETPSMPTVGANACALAANAAMATERTIRQLILDGSLAIPVCRLSRV